MDAIYYVYGIYIYVQKNKIRKILMEQKKRNINTTQHMDSSGYQTKILKSVELKRYQIK